MSTTEQPQSPEWLAERMGISRATVMEHIKAGRIPAFRIGKFYRVLPSEVAAHFRVLSRENVKREAVQHG